MVLKKAFPKVTLSSVLYFLFFSSTKRANCQPIRGLPVGPYSWTTRGASPALLLSTVKVWGTCARTPISRPGPKHLTLLGSTSSRTGTLNGLPETRTKTFGLFQSPIGPISWKLRVQDAPPGTGRPPKVMLTSYSPGVKGIYSTLQLPSLLSLQDIFASDGPSMARPSPPVPAPLKNNGSELELKLLQSVRQSCWMYLVSTVKQFVALTRPSSRPGPKARTRLGSQPSVTDTLNGLFGSEISSNETSIRCKPADRTQASFSTWSTTDPRPSSTGNHQEHFSHQVSNTPSSSAQEVEPVRTCHSTQHKTTCHQGASWSVALMYGSVDRSVRTSTPFEPSTEHRTNI